MDIINIAKGDRLPVIVSQLIDTDETNVPLSIAAGDLVAFYMKDARTEEIHQNWNSADSTISDYTNSKAQFSWPASSTDITPGLMACLWRVTYGATSKVWSMKRPFFVSLWEI